MPGGGPQKFIFLMSIPGDYKAVIYPWTTFRGNLSVEYGKFNDDF